MANHSFRSTVVVVLLLGTLALAVPYVSGTVDALLFSDGQEAAKPKWKTQRPPAHEPPQTLHGAVPKLVLPGEQSSFNAPPLEELKAAPASFEFDFHENPQSDVRRTDHVEQVVQPGIPALQHELQDLGASYLTVEQDGDRFECRSLFPLSPESSYQKAFSGVGSTPEAAMQQVLAEVQNWQRANTKVR